VIPMRTLHATDPGTFAVGLLMLVLGVLSAHAGTGEESELARTWNAARIYVPATSAAGYHTVSSGEMNAAIASSEPPPAGIVLYAHGCDGLSGITDATGRFLAQAGYAVAAPDGFARLDKPTSCEPAKHQGGLHRAVLGWRQAEIRYALDRLRELPSLAGLSIVLMGHSEGAIATATVADLAVAARIVEGWTCHAGWPEYRGLNAPPGQPVLALVGENDPWFRDPELTGDCGAFMKEGMDDDGISHSIVYRAPNYLSAKHWLSSDQDVQREILEFIESAISTERKQ
jgi:dienelactone hydrolase